MSLRIVVTPATAAIAAVVGIALLMALLSWPGDQRDVPSVPQWEEDGCDKGRDVACGLFLPLRQDMRRETSLPVAVLQHARARNSEIASVFLTGGPGGATRLDDDAMAYWREWRDTLALDHDLVLYDQRGSFEAWPSLECPGYLDLMLRELGKSSDGEIAQSAGWRAYETIMLRCARNLPAEDRRSGLYSTATHRTDLLELLQALKARFGYRGFVLYGASYGSRLALETAQAAPAGLIERVVLDGFYTPGIDLDARYPCTLDEAVADFERWCGSEPDCDAAGGAFGERLQAALDRVAALPTIRTVDLGDWDPATPTIDMHVGATALLAIVAQALSSGDDAAALPRVLDAIAAGNWSAEADTLAQNLAFNVLDASFSPLAFHLVECRDNAELDRAAYDGALAASPRFAALLPYLRATEGFCKRLGVTPAPLAASTSDVDALVVSMQVEPVTPWRAAREGLALLRHAEWRLVRGVGHVASDRDACAATAIGAYMNSGALAAWDDCDLVESARFERGRIAEPARLPAAVERAR